MAGWFTDLLIRCFHIIFSTKSNDVNPSCQGADEEPYQFFTRLQQARRRVNAVRVAKSMPAEVVLTRLQGGLRVSYEGTWYQTTDEPAAQGDWVQVGNHAFVCVCVCVFMHFIRSPLPRTVSQRRKSGEHSAASSG